MYAVIYNGKQIGSIEFHGTFWKAYIGERCIGNFDYSAYAENKVIEAYDG